MISDWGEVVTRYPYGNVRMDHLLSKELNVKLSILLVVFFITKLNIGNYIVNIIEKPN